MSKFWQKKEQATAVAVNDDPVMEVNDDQDRRRRSSSSSNNSSVEPPQRARTKPARINPQFSPPSDPSLSSPMSPTSDMLDDKREFPTPVSPIGRKSRGIKGRANEVEKKEFQHPHHDIEAAEPVFEVFPQRKQASWLRRHAFVIGVCTVTVISFLIIGLVLVYHLKPKQRCQTSWGCGSDDAGRN